MFERGLIDIVIFSFIGGFLLLKACSNSMFTALKSQVKKLMSERILKKKICIVQVRSHRVTERDLMGCLKNTKYP